MVWPRASGHACVRAGFWCVVDWLLCGWFGVSQNFDYYGLGEHFRLCGRVALCGRAICVVFSVCGCGARERLL